jgi:hypothetical protein
LHKAKDLKIAAEEKQVLSDKGEFYVPSLFRKGVRDVTTIVTEGQKMRDRI